MSAAPNTLPLGCITTVKRALVAVLSGPAYVAALAEVGRLVGTTVPLVPFTAVYPSEQDGVKSVPYVELLSGGSEPTADGDARSQEREHEIGLLLHNGGGDASVVTEQLELYALAVQRLLSREDGDGSLVPFVGADLRVGAVDYSPVEKKDGALMKACLITVRATTFD